MPEFAFAGSQTLGDLPQRFRLRQLTKQHRYELAPTAEPTRVPLGVMLAHRRFKVIARH